MNAEDMILSGSELATVDITAPEADCARAQTLAQQRQVPMPEALRLAVALRITRERLARDAGTSRVPDPVISKTLKVGEDSVFNVAIACTGAEAILRSVDGAAWSVHTTTFTAEAGQSVRAFGVKASVLSSDVVMLNV